MSENRDTLELLAKHLTGALEPLRRAVSSEDAFRAFMLRLGWRTSNLPSEYLDIAPAVTDAIETIEDLSDDPSAGEVLDCLIKAKNIFDAIQGISTAPPDVDAGEFLSDIGERLFELLWTDYLASNLPTAYNLFSILNVIEMENIAPTSEKAGYIRTRFKWGEIPKIISEPQTLPERVYGWGTDELNTELLIQHLSELFFALDFPVVVDRADKLLAAAFHEADADLDDDIWMLKVPFYYITIGDQNYEAAISLMELKADEGKLPGIIIQPLIPQEFPITLELAPNIDLNILAGTDIASKFGLLIRPDGVSVNFPFKSGDDLPSAKLGVGFDFHPETPVLIFGQPNSTRLQLQGFSTGIKTTLDDGEIDVVFSADLKELSLILAAGEGDGFINKIIGDGETGMEISLGIDMSNKNGVNFRGSGGFEISINPHIDLGPIAIENLTTSLYVPDDPKPKAVLALGAGISGDLGPLQFVIEGIGLKVNTLFEDGNAGPFDINLGFKPPNGVGLSVDAGAVKGGGYLFFDFEREEYAGALELVFSEWIALKAIGLITTKMPDGSKGFSMLIIITVEFGTGIQLGFGFTLLGVGGLLGINRIVNIEPLKDGIRTGAVESVMFPQNVIANAPKIISDLRKFFPPTDDLFLIGPMAKIGWGTPTLISVSIGIIMEIPSVNITILGVVKVVLPDEEADILRLQVNFIGRIEPSNERLWFYAELFDSRVLFITLEGGMGLLVGWGDNANFVVSVGGFHPRYSPPPLPFPEPPRIAVSILNESYAKVRIEAYFAVTSNSVQFGAKAELYFGVSEFRIEGFLAFDALFQFDPFFFSFSLSVSLSVKVFGVGLFSVGFSGLLEGPTPWYIEGKGKISLLFFKIKVPFSHTWGEEEDTKLDPIEVFPLIEKELNALTNWVAQLPESSNILVSLRKLGESEEDQLVLHPVGTLRISQRKIPLDFNLDKVGNQTPSDVNKLNVEASVNGGGDLAVSEIREKFAIGQFKELDDSKRLSSPAFEPLDGGVEMAVEGEQVKTSQAVKRVIRYESIIIDNYYKRFVKPFFEFLVAGFTGLYEFLFEHFMAGNAVSKSELSNHHKKRMQPFDQVIEIKPHEYSVAFNTNNKPMDGEAANFTSQAKADQFMEQKIQDDPKLADQLHVIPNTEINTAA